MAFDSVIIKNFRNLKEQNISLSSREVHLIGQNGQGKTNFLELLYYLCYGSSFRIKNDKMLIAKDESKFSISGSFKYPDDIIKNCIEISYDGIQKKIRLNGKPVKDRKDILTILPCIVFCHNDIYFVNGNPERKRIYLDQCISLNNILYINDLRNYRKLLKERNFLLKQGKEDILPIYTEQLIEKGIILQKEREKVIHFIKKHFSSYFNTINNNENVMDLDIQYNPSWKSGDKKEIYKAMENRRTKEFQYGMTLSGPHRDTFTILSGKKDFLNFASTGQLRIISLILRMLQAEYYKKNKDKRPIFLVDDVLLELDFKKRKAMMEVFPDYEQIFYTFLPGYAKKRSSKALCLEVMNGLLEKKNE